MRIKINSLGANYHPLDDLRDSFSPTGELLPSICEGLNLWMKYHPEAKKRVVEDPGSVKKIIGENNGKLYAVFPDEPTTIYPISCRTLTAILVTEAEFGFGWLALIAEKKISTDQVEERILHLKEAVQMLSQNSERFIAEVPEENILECNPDTPLSVLRVVPTKKYIVDEMDHVWGIIPVPHHENIYILVPEVDNTVPKLQLLFDGRNFLALYLENLPEQARKLLAPGEGTELPGVYQ